MNKEDDIFSPEYTSDAKLGDTSSGVSVASGTSRSVETLIGAKIPEIIDSTMGDISIKEEKPERNIISIDLSNE